MRGGRGLKHKKRQKQAKFQHDQKSTKTIGGAYNKNQSRVEGESSRAGRRRRRRERA